MYTIDFGENKDFGNGKVTVGLPYVLGEGKDPNRLSIYYISDGKVAEEIECQYGNDSVTFTLGHFSTYAIVYDDSAPSDGGFPVLYAVIGAVAVIAVAGAVFFLIRKR